MPRRLTNNLRKGRISIPHATYFVTATVQHRKRCLDKIEVFERTIGFLDTGHQDNIATTYGFILMPDHVHWLFQLGSKTSLGQCVRMLKFNIGDSVQDGSFGWQSNYFEHRLREEENKESYAQYIFLNPYRAGLIKTNQSWPYWIGNASFEFNFEAALEESKYPPKAWIGEVKNPYKQWLETSVKNEDPRSASS